MTTALDVQNDLNNHFDLVKMRKEAEEGEEGRMMSFFFGEKIWELYQVGEWLTWRMEKEGAAPKETGEQSFVVGQYAFPNKNAFEIAAAVFDRWVDGRPDKPGIELGMKLADEFLGT